jgi:polysaccharide biosynthesis transport protein
MNDQTEVKLHFLDYWRVIKMRIGLILLTFFLVVVTTSVYVFFLPKKYLSKVTLEIKPDSNRGVDPLGATSASSRGYDPQFISTQFQVLQKNEILYKVIDRLDLIKKLSPSGQTWPKSAISNVMIGDMEVQEKRNTSLIEVGIYNSDRQLAADIANTIASVYQESRIDEQGASVRTGLGEIKSELEEQKKNVAKLNEECSVLRQERSIVDPDPENSNVLVGLGIQEKVNMIERQVGDQQAKVDILRSQLARIDVLKPEQLMEALRTLEIDDPTISGKLPLMLEAGVEEAKMLASGVGENHPRVKAIRSQKDVYAKILADQLDGLRRSLATKLQIHEDTLKTFNTKQADAKKEHGAEKEMLKPYVEKKSAYLMAKQLMQTLDLRLAATRIDSAITFKPVIIREKAEASVGRAAKPKILTWIGLSLVMGAVLGIALAFFIEYLDTSVKTIDDIERYLQLPVLAVVPRDISVLINQRRDGHDAEIYRILKANLELSGGGRDSNTFTLVSGGPGEGKSTTLNNLAFTYAKGGARVLVVDADLRRPSQHRFFGTENATGLADYLLGRLTIDQIVKPTKLDNLSFIPSGKLPHDDAGILNGQKMIDFINEVRTRYDVVFFDSPPILGVSDASNLASWIENTIMVVQHRRFPRAMLQRVKQSVSRVGGNLRGVVLNNVDTKNDDSYSYYSNYNEYYGSKNRAEAPLAAGKSNNDNNDEY